MHSLPPPFYYACTSIYGANYEWRKDSSAKSHLKFTVTIRTWVLNPLETIRALSLPRALTLSASRVSFLTLSSLSVQNLLLLSLCVDDPDWRSVSKQKQSKGTPADFHDL